MNNKQYKALFTFIKLFKINSKSESMLNRYKKMCKDLELNAEQEKELSVIFDLHHWY